MDWIAKIMDWYFDFLMLICTFFVIAAGMTIYVRIHPLRSRFHKYVYTGIIPTITITTCEDTPNLLLSPPPSQETSDSDESSNNEEDSTKSTPEESISISNSTEYLRRDSLQVPILDDDDDEEETAQVVEIETLPLMESKTEDIQNVQVCLPDSPVLERKENIIKMSNSDDNLIATVCLLDSPVLERKENIIKTSDSDDNLIATVCLPDSPVLEKKENIIKTSDGDNNLIATDESSNKKHCLVNGFTWKYGTSHTVEDPLFPFSEVFEEEKPLIRNRFQKRLSQ